MKSTAPTRPGATAPVVETALGLWIWRHDSGRVAVAGHQPDFAMGDPSWHRGVPCELRLPPDDGDYEHHDRLGDALERLETLTTALTAHGADAEPRWLHETPPVQRGRLLDMLAALVTEACAAHAAFRP